MDILHFLNVLIGFSLVMLVLSIITGGAAQAVLVFLNTRTRAIADGLAGLLVGVGINKTIDKKYAMAIIVGLLIPPDNLDSSGEENPQDATGFIKVAVWLRKKLSWLIWLISLISTAYARGAPQNISREELLLLLLRKASIDNELALSLGFTKDEATNAPDAPDAKTKAAQALQEIEKRILQEEVNDPKLPLQMWRTRALNAIVPDLAARVFGRFDDAMDRALDKVSERGKQWSFVLTLPLLLLYWPVDSIDLINRLYVDKALSASVAGLADSYAAKMKNVPNEIGGDCGTENQTKRLADITVLKNTITTSDPTKPEDKAKLDTAQANLKTTQQAYDLCEQKIKDKQTALSEEMYSSLTAKGLFGDTNRKDKSLTPGIFISWILVSMGSTFWLGVLNKMLGLRSDLNKKLEEQRASRAADQT